MLLQTVPVVGTDIAPSATGLSLWSLFIACEPDRAGGDDRAAGLLGLGLGHRHRQDVLYARTRREMDKFEAAFWSGESLEELYRTLSGKPNHSMAALFVAAMREWKRTFEGSGRSIAGLQMRIEKVMQVSIAREIERLERRLLVLATVGSAGPFVGLFGTVVRHHDQLPVDRRLEEHFAGGGRARHRRGPVRDRDRPCRRHTGDHFL